MRSIKKIIKFFNIENNSPVKKKIFFFLLFISISGTIFSLLSNYINFYFDFDQYELITAAESISENKLGGISFFPNSSRVFLEGLTDGFRVAHLVARATRGENLDFCDEK